MTEREDRLALALEEIAKLKPEKVAAGFVTGPQALLNAAQRVAREALRIHRAADLANIRTASEIERERLDRKAALRLSPVMDGMLKALRRLSIVQTHQMAYGGGTVHVGYTCKTCGSDWERGQPEIHKPECLAALSAPHPQARGEDWKDDPSADELEQDKQAWENRRARDAGVTVDQLLKLDLDAVARADVSKFPPKSDRELAQEAIIIIEAHFIMTFGTERVEAIRRLSAPVFECSARKQSLPEPGECNWPDCGCDPHAIKVIESLLEQGWTPRTDPQFAADARPSEATAASNEVALRIAADLATIVSQAEKHGTLPRLKSVAIYFDEMELRTIIKSLRDDLLQRHKITQAAPALPASRNGVDTDGAGVSPIASTRRESPHE